MKIIVDCNNDRITVDNIEMPCKQPIQMIRILEEIFNHLDFVNGIELDKIDEDVHSNIGYF